MKLRRPVLALTIISGVLGIIGIVSFVVLCLLAGSQLFLEYFMAANQVIGLSLIFQAPIYYAIISYATILIAVGLTIAWLIVDLKRKRRLVWLFVPMHLAISYCFLFIGLFVLTNLTTTPGGNLGLFFIPSIAAALAFIFSIILFIVDIKTGKEIKEIKPAQIYHDIKEEEVKPIEEASKEEVIPAPVVEETQPKEEAPTIVEEAIKSEEVEVEDRKDEKDFTTEPKEASERKTRTISKEDIAAANKKAPRVTKEDGTTYAKAYHVSRRQELNKWQVKATGSSKAIKLFDTQKEAIEYAEALSRSNGAMVRVHSKAGKLRKN